MARKLAAKQAEKEVSKEVSKHVDEAGGGKQLLGAAGAGAVAGIAVGAAVGIPILGGVAGAAGLTYLAVQKGSGGKAARAVGGAAVAAGSKAKELNRKHGLDKKAAKAGKSVVSAGKRLNKKFHITHNLGVVANAGADALNKAAGRKEESKEDD